MIFQKIKGNNDTFGLEIRILSTKVYFEEIFKMRASSAKLHKKRKHNKDFPILPQGENGTPVFKNEYKKTKYT